MIEILFRLPYTKRQHLIDEKIGNPKTVGNYLITLEKNGFLKSVKVGKEKLFRTYKTVGSMLWLNCWHTREAFVKFK